MRCFYLYFSLYLTTAYNSTLHFISSFKPHRFLGRVRKEMGCNKLKLFIRYTVTFFSLYQCLQWISGQSLAAFGAQPKSICGIQAHENTLSIPNINFYPHIDTYSLSMGNLYKCLPVALRYNNILALAARDLTLPRLT